jgi:hypothetical protein
MARNWETRMPTSREIAAALKHSTTFIEESTFALFANHPLLMGIGTIPFDQVSSTPFSGKLPIMVNFQAAVIAGAAYYQVVVNGVPTTDSWTNYKWNGKINVLQTVNVKWIGQSGGCYPVHQLRELFLWQSPALGSVLDSRALTDGAHSIELQFLDSAGAPLPALKSGPIYIAVNNKQCAAEQSAPTQKPSTGCSSLCCPYEPAYS